MSIKLTITHDEADKPALAVALITVGIGSDADIKHTLQPGKALTVELEAGQFVLVDEIDT